MAFGRARTTNLTISFTGIQETFEMKIPALLPLFFVSAFCFSQSSPKKVEISTAPLSTATITRASGGSIQTPLGMGIILNKESGLTREWIAVHDPSLPVELMETPGVRTIYVPDRVRGEYQYSSQFMIDAKEPISAIEVRFLTFDIWGRHVRTLSASEIMDIPIGPKILNAKWELYSENECSEYYASIGYIARIRKANGKIVESDPGLVMQEAKKFSSKFTPADLDPKPAPK